MTFSSSDHALVPRTRSSRTSNRKHDRELRVQRGTRIIELLVVLRFRGSHRGVPQALANLGIGPLAALRICCTLLLALLALPAGWATYARAETWPQRSVKFIVPLGPGSGADI